MTNGEQSDESAPAWDRPFTDPEFTAVALSIDVADATEKIHGAVKGLHATETAVGVKIRTTDGMLVAVVSEPAGVPDPVESVVQYRTEPESELATRKAGKLGAALDPFRTEFEAATPS